MSEDEIGQNMVPWKSEASERPMLAVSRVEEAAVDPMKSAADGVTHGAEEQRGFMSKADERFGETSQGFAQGGAETKHMMLALVSTAQGGMQNLHECVAGLLEGVVRTNLRLAREMFLVDSPRALMELQQRFVSEYLDAFQQGAAALIRATSQPEKNALSPSLS